MFLLGYPMALHLGLIFKTFSDISTTDSFILLILWLELHHTQVKVLVLNFTENGKTERELRLLIVKSLANDLAKVFHIFCH